MDNTTLHSEIDVAFLYTCRLLTTRFETSKERAWSTFDIAGAINEHALQRSISLIPTRPSLLFASFIRSSIRSTQQLKQTIILINPSIYSFPVPTRSVNRSFNTMAYSFHSTYYTSWLVFWLLILQLISMFLLCWTPPAGVKYYGVDIRKAALGVENGLRNVNVVTGIAPQVSFVPSLRYSGLTATGWYERL